MDYTINNISNFFIIRIYSLIIGHGQYNFLLKLYYQPSFNLNIRHHHTSSHQYENTVFLVRLLTSVRQLS